MKARDLTIFPNTLSTTIWARIWWPVVIEYTTAALALQMSVLMPLDGCHFVEVIPSRFAVRCSSVEYPHYIVAKSYTYRKVGLLIPFDSSLTSSEY